MSSNRKQRLSARPRARIFGRSLVVLFALGLPATVAVGEPLPTSAPPAVVVPLPPFLFYKVKRGVAIDRRPIPGSRFFEYRAGFTVPLEARRIADQIWRGSLEVASDELIKKRQILLNTADERVFYDQIKTPVVSDRDYTLLVRRIDDPMAQRFQVTYDTANQLGPPTQPGFVRIPTIRGSWTAEADGQGGTRMTYLNFNDPGGSIPAFVVHGAQVDNVATTVLRLQEKLRQLAR